MKPKLTDAAKGKWAAILPQLGVGKDFLTGRHGACPICQTGKDRFRFDNKDGRGTWFCSQCGAGDGVELVKRVNGWEFKQAAPEIEKLLGTAPVIAIRNGPHPDDVKREMNDIWRGGRALVHVPAAAAYWAMRIGAVPEHPDLRGVNSLTCPGQGAFPGMVALIRDTDGKPVNMHRTFLSEVGEKAEIPEPRRVMPLPLPKGCAVRLASPTDVLGIAEGIETAAAVTEMFGIPCWAAMTAQNLIGWEPPAQGLKIIVFGDNDQSLTGHWASYALARRLRMTKWEVDVRIPETVGSDWNDMLSAQTAGYRVRAG